MLFATRFKLLAVITIIALGALTPFLILTYFDYRDAKNDAELSARIKLNFFDRAALRDRYFLYHEDRTSLLWDNNKKQADDLLSQSSGLIHSETDRTVLDNLRRDIADNTEIFHRIVSNYKSMQESEGNHFLFEALDKRLSSQLLLKAASIKEDIFEIEQSTVRRVEDAFLRLTFAIGLFALSIAFAAIFILNYLGSLIRQRLAPLQQGAEMIAEGNLTYQIASDGTDEFALLAQSINKVTSRLNDEIKAHVDAENQLEIIAKEQTAITSSKIVGIVKLKDRKFVWTNTVFAEMLGYTKEELIGQPTRIVYPSEETYLAFANAAYPVMQRNEIFRTEIQYKRKDGTLGWYEISGGLLGLGSAESIWAFVDITHRKELEKQRDEAVTRFSNLLTNLQTGVVIQTPTSEIVFSNARALSLLGLTEDQLLGKTSFDTDWKVIHEDGTPFPSSTHPVPQSISTRQPIHDVVMGVYRPVFQDISWLLVNADPELNPDGTVKQVVCTFTDISERKKYEWRLVQLSFALDHVREAAYLMDEEGKFLYVNNEACRMLGYTSEELTDGMCITDIDPNATIEQYHQHWQLLKNGGLLTRETFHRNIDGNKFPIELTGTYFEYDGKGYNLAMVRDITERKALEEQIQLLAYYDPLTKLPNRRLLTDRLSQVMSASRRSGVYGAIIFLDLDNFKPLNDIHGHAIGDLLLVEAAIRLKSCVREMDTVARFGGDEFVIMLSELDTDKNASISQAKRVAEKILALLSAKYKISIKSNEGYADRIVEHHCTASIGVAVFVNQQNSQEEIIGWADAAMYQAKESGRNQIRLYEANA